jgi:hypothetical protein
MSSLTIGVFDGVHRGHQSILRQLDDQPIVVTFSNHPAEILKSSPPPLLCSCRLKLALLKEFGVNNTVVIPFTRALSEMTFEDFLAPYSFRHLILGDGAAFGKNGQGNADALRIFGLQRGFTVQSISKFLIGNQPISSTRIRSLITDGKLIEAENLLGRPYCIDYSPELKSFQNIVLPPDGLYTVWSHSKTGVEMIELTIRDQILRPSANKMQLISFGPNLNPNLFNYLCQISPAVS